MERARWVLTETESDASLRGLCAVDADTVWACGSNGTVLHTSDGGVRWRKMTVPGPNLELRDVFALDDRTAFVLSVTKPACILRTTDGGRRWEEVYRSPHADAFLDSFAFFDRKRGCVFGDPIDGTFVVVRTEDGGRTWVDVPADQLPPATEGEAAFAASGTCIVTHGEQHAWIATGGLTTRVLCSDDGGKSWIAAHTPMLDGAPTTGIYSVAFRDAEHGVVVGGDYTTPKATKRNAAFTENGGLTWTLVEEAVAPRGHRAAVAYIPRRAHSLVTVGRAGSDYSDDDGRTWHSLGGMGFFAVAFAPSGEGWAAGSEGRIARLDFDWR